MLNTGMFAIFKVSQSLTSLQNRHELEQVKNKCSRDSSVKSQKAQPALSNLNRLWRKLETG